MNYTFTEKKRIRKSFAKRETILEVPYLLTTQLESYDKFLQQDRAADKRADEGLQAAFGSIFPIVSNNGYAELQFEQYILGVSCVVLPMRHRCAPKSNWLFSIKKVRPK